MYVCDFAWAFLMCKRMWMRVSSYMVLAFYLKTASCTCALRAHCCLGAQPRIAGDTDCGIGQDELRNHNTADRQR